MRFMFQAAVVLLITCVVGASPAYAQRYLTEFVGTAKVTADFGVASLASNLQFDTLDGRVLDGAFTFVEQDATGAIEVEPFSADAVLAASGQCPGRITAPDADGHLRLAEHVFDAKSFALLGSIDVDEDPGAVKLTEGRLRGPIGLLNPPADALEIGVRRASLLLADSTGRAIYDVELDDVDPTGVVRGSGYTDRGAAAFDVVVSANGAWFYLLLVSEDGFMVGRGAVSLDERGAPVGGEGSYEVVTEAGKTIDRGTFAIELR